MARLHGLEPFVSFTTSLKAATMSEQWSSHVAKIGGKMFAMRGGESGDIMFKVSALSFDVLTSLEGVGQAPYLAKGAWVRVSREAPLSDSELKAYISGSYEMIAAKLTRKLRAELGLD